MVRTIEAIYEKGLFRPLTPVDLPDGTHVRIEAELLPTDPDTGAREKLLADGATPEETEKILDNFKVLWSSYETLTDEQKKALEESRLNQHNFFSLRAQAYPQILLSSCCT
jgi:predicted DNA-binding antitoxin AbrB/MazE fold protein